MSKSISSIIQQLSQNPPKQMPIYNLNKTSQADLQQLNQFFKRGDKSKLCSDSLIVLKIIDSDIKKALKRDDYLVPLLGINYNVDNNNTGGNLNKNSKYLNEARTKLCQEIILKQDLQRLSVIDFHLNALQAQNDIDVDQNVRAKMALIRADRYAISGQFLRASISYLDASRKQAFINDQFKKKEIVQKSIAYAFLTPQSPQAHKVICSLYLNQIAKMCKFSLLVEQLYSRQMISSNEVSQISKILPQKLKQKDIDGVSSLNKATFSHNMASLIKCFKCIQFQTAVDLIGLNLDQLLILIEKTYKNREVLIDQVEKYLYFVDGQQFLPDVMVRDFLQGIDSILQQ